MLCFFLLVLFTFIYFIFKLYIIVLVLPNFGEGWLVGSQFLDQGLNLGHGSEIPEF